jgi:hypothetical protein
VRLCDFELATVSFMRQTFVASCGEDVPTFPLLRGTSSMSHQTHRTDQRQFDDLHWMHGRWFFRTGCFLRSQEAFSKRQVCMPFGPRFDIDVAMFAASIPAFDRGLERALVAQDTYDAHCLSWALAGHDGTCFLGPAQLLPYLFCTPAHYHVCSVASHSVRDAIPKNINFPFAGATAILRLLCDGTLSPAAQTASRLLCHSHLARICTRSNIPFYLAPCTIFYKIQRSFEKNIGIIIGALAKCSCAEEREEMTCECLRTFGYVITTFNEFIQNDCGCAEWLETLPQCGAFMRHLFFFCPLWCRTQNTLTNRAKNIHEHLKRAEYCSGCLHILQRLVVLTSALDPVVGRK